MKKPQELHVAALQWVPASGSTYNLFAAVGNGKTNSSEVIELTAGNPANRWTEVAGLGITGSTFTVDGTEGAGAGWADSARPTGQLAVTTPVGTSNNIYVAAQEGIVEDRAGTWSTANLTYSTDTAVAPTGMTIYPTTTTSGIASTNNGFVTLENQIGTTNAKLGVWFVNNLGSGTTSAVCQVKVPTGVAAADPAQEVLGLQEPDTSGVLYVAYGQDGLWRYALPSSPPTLNSVCTTGTWTQVLNVSGNSPSGAGDCSMNSGGEGGLGSVAGYTTGTGAIVWAGCNAPSTSAVSNELWRITVNDSTSTMTEEGIGGGGTSSGSANISSNINMGSLTWWHIDPSPGPAPNTSTPLDALGASLFVPAQLAVEPPGSGYGTQVWASGRSGVWRSLNAGASAMSSVNFAPVVSGLSSTVDFQVVGAPDTTYTSQVIDADHDWQVLLSTNSMKSGEPVDQEPDQIVKPHPAATSASLYDTGSSDAAVVGFGDGNVYYNLNPFASTPDAWVPLGTLSGAPAVYGLVVETNASNDIVILAATGYQNATNKGIGYMVCGTTLTSCGTTWHYPTSLTTMFGSNNQNNSFTFFWSATASSQYVYVYDQNTGLWASNNYGESGWVNIGMDSNVTATGVEAAQVGYLTGYVTGSTTTLWVSNGVYVFKYSPTPTCYTAGTCTGTKLATSSFSNPGPLTADSSGNLYVTEEAASSYGPILWELASGATTPVQVNDSEYPAYMVEPDSISPAPDGSELYLSSPGQGIGVVTP